MGGRAIQTATLGSEAQWKDGFSITAPPEDPLYGEIATLSLSLNARVDNEASSAILFHRLRGSRSNPGYIAFEATRKHPGGPVTLRLTLTGENGGESAVATEPIDLYGEEWAQLAVVCDGAQAHFYHNGARIGDPVPFTAKAPAIPADRCALSIHHFKGGISEVVIAPNRVLGDEQIRDFYQKGLKTFYESF